MRQLKLQTNQTELQRPISKQNLKDFICNYIETNTTEIGETITKQAIINQLAVKEAVEIANNEKYHVETIEEELKYTINKLLGLGMILSFPLFTTANISGMCDIK